MRCCGAHRRTSSGWSCRNVLLKSVTNFGGWRPQKPSSCGDEVLVCASKKTRRSLEQIATVLTNKLESFERAELVDSADSVVRFSNQRQRSGCGMFVVSRFARVLQAALFAARNVTGSRFIEAKKNRDRTRNDGLVVQLDRRGRFIVVRVRTDSHNSEVRCRAAARCRRTSRGPCFARSDSSSSGPSVASTSTQPQ